MGGDQRSIDRHAATELLGWWLESGVDVALAEQPRDWRRTAAPTYAGEAKAATAVVREPAAAPAEPIPADLRAFRIWLEQAAGLPLDRPGAVRSRPVGEAEAEIMLLTDMAAADNRSEPLGGDAMELARRMLAAIGFAPDQAYLATLSCFSGPGLRLSAADLERCAEIARHHISLVQPKRLILFGDSPSRALLGGTVAQKRGKIHKVEGVRTIATFAPAWLLNRPADKALAWRDLLLLMEE